MDGVLPSIHGLGIRMLYVRDVRLPAGVEMGAIVAGADYFHWGELAVGRSLLLCLFAMVRKYHPEDHPGHDRDDIACGDILFEMVRPESTSDSCIPESDCDNGRKTLCG